VRSDTPTLMPRAFISRIRGRSLGGQQGPRSSSFPQSVWGARIVQHLDVMFKPISPRPGGCYSLPTLSLNEATT